MQVLRVGGTNKIFKKSWGAHVFKSFDPEAEVWDFEFPLDCRLLCQGRHLGQDCLLHVFDVGCLIHLMCSNQSVSFGVSFRRNCYVCC